jgi:hypothetical protein
MNKSTIFIGLGVLAIGGLAYWYFSKPSSAVQIPSDLGKSAVPPIDESTIYDTGVPTGSDVALGAPKSRKQTRRDCRAEAKSRGLRGRAKRQFKRECKASGGINADTADFAFNGFDGAFEFA